MKMTDILHRYYGEFDLINEKRIIKNIKDAVWQRKHPKKKATLQVFRKKDQDNKNIPYTDRDLGDELVIVVIDDCHCGIFIIPKEVAISKKFFLQRIVKERWLCGFIRPGAQI